MAKYKCKMCGAPLDVQEGQTVITCEFCGSKQTVANANDERKENLFNRANSLRATCEFDKAILAYQSILSIFPDEPEAHFGLCLCKYGIEYVDDPATRAKVPTIHRMSYDSILKDSDYIAALAYADVVAREEYQDEAKQIADIQRNVLAISQKEDPFDVFICYKETGENGKRTPDSVLAQEIYSELTEKGYKVFFSRITLESKLGSMYEPYIFAALNSAKVMLVIGTKKEYFEAIWVKNEWSRFLDLMKTRPDHYLIPCYRGMDAYEMPEQFLALQGQDMGKLGFMQDLLRGIDKIMGRAETLKARTETQILQTDVNVGALLKRAEILLEDENFSKADEVLEKVLDNDPTNARAYLLKLVLELGLSSVDALVDTDEILSGFGNFKKAYEFGDEKQKAFLDAIEKEKEEKKYSKAYSLALDYKNSGSYEEAEKTFLELGEYRDAKERAEECRGILNETEYERGLSLKESEQFEEAIQVFQSIIEYKDSESMVQQCVEGQKDVFLRNRYEKAIELKEGGNPWAASRVFETLKTYRDSETQIEECERLADEAVNEMVYSLCVFDRDIVLPHDLGRLKDACKKLESLSGFRDSDALLSRYEKMIDDYEADLKRKTIEANERRARKRKKIKKIALISGISAVGLTIALLLTFLVFIPLGRQSSIPSLIDAGRYDEAMSLIQDNGSFGDTKNLAEMCKAGKRFDDGEFEKGIDLIYNIGGTVDVHYDADGGTPEINNQIIKRDAHINNPTNKNGYDFNSWRLTDYSLDSKNHAASIVLKAQYQATTYHLTYEMNLGYCESDRPETYTIEEAVPIPNAKRHGYTFLGWTGTDLKEPTIDYVIPKGSTGDRNLIAVWEANSYTVALDTAGGVLQDSTTTVVFEEPYSLPIPTRVGYTFDGWYDGVKEFPLSGVWEITEGRSLRALWVSQVGEITLDGNGGSVSPFSVSVTFGHPYTLPTPKREGYTFTGWFLGSSKIIQLSGIWEHQINVRLVASWKANECVITLDSNHGVISNDKITVFYGQPYSLPIPTRPGCSFVGWFDGKAKVENDGVWKDSSKTLTARWTSEPFPITYILNGGENNSENPEEYVVDSGFEFASPTRDGFAFAGWYVENELISAIPDSQTGPLTIEAKWAPLVMDELNGGGIEISKCDATTPFVEFPSEISGKFVRSLGASIFTHPDSIRVVSIPSTVWISEEALAGCESLRTIKISLGSSVNSRVNLLTMFNVSTYSALPKSFTTVEILPGSNYSSISRLFSNTSNIAPGEGRLHVVLPDGLTYISNWFQNNRAISSVDIPDSVKELYNYSFSGCTSLASVDIPDSVTIIGDYGFNKCQSLSSVHLPAPLTTIGNHAFSECSSLRSVELPDSVTGIGDYAFYRCESLDSVSFSASLATIGKSAFSLSSVKSIVLPESLSSIGDYAFAQCARLSSASLNSSLSSLGVYAFSQCPSLSAIVLPSSLLAVGESVFCDCDSLATVSLSNSINAIETSAFEGCSALVKVDLSKSSMDAIDAYAFSGCSALVKVTLPDSLAHIHGFAFENCSSLANISLPRSLKTIRNGTFRGCSSLENLSIPSSLEYLGSSAFFGCESLHSLTYDGTKTKWESIQKGAGWEEGSGIERIVCTDGEILLKTDKGQIE